MKIHIRNQQRHRPLNNTRITRTARMILAFLERPMSELSILFVGDKKMSQLNAEYRGINKSTDVLSFPQNFISQRLTKGNENIASVIPVKTGIQRKNWIPGQARNDVTDSQLLLGDVVISIPRAEYQAKVYGWSFYDELLRLLIHGILHLSGYDHETSGYRARIMIKKEQELFNAIKKMGSKHQPRH